MTRLRAGIIGLGVGERHIAGYHAHPACRVAALCDFDAGALERAGERHPDMRLLTRAEDVLDDPEIDVVSIASYDSYHYDQVRRALERGKHVFVEKPLCQYPAQASEIHALLRDRPGLRLSSNLPLRLSPRFQLLKEMIGAGELGELFFLEGDYDYGRLHKITAGWRGDEDRYSVVLGGAVHVVDLLLWLTGRRVTQVSARGNRIAAAGSKYRFDDFVVATLELEGGLLAKVSANFGCVHPHFHAVKVFGTEATFVNGLPDATLYTERGEHSRARAIDAAYPGVDKGALIHSFIESIVTEAPAAVTADEVFETMAVCFAIEQATSSAGPVSVRGFD